MQTRRSRLSTLWNRARTSHAVFCTSSVLYYLLLTNYVANKFAFISRNRYATSSNSGDTLPRWFYYVFGLPFTFKLGLDGSATIQNFLAFNKEEKNMITEIWADVHGETILSKALGEAPDKQVISAARTTPITMKAYVAEKEATSAITEMTDWRFWFERFRDWRVFVVAGTTELRLALSPKGLSPTDPLAAKEQDDLVIKVQTRNGTWNLQKAFIETKGKDAVCIPLA